jgi:hypothetical protein
MDVLFDRIADWHQGRGGRANPIGHRGDIQFDALAGEEFALTVKGEMRAVFSRQDFGEQLRASPSARNRAGGCVIPSQALK